ncbi:MAG TPA: GNAT family N-acetyltransferase [Thermoleophilaceae bacterium]
MPVTLRPAAPQDADALAALVHDAYVHYVERIGREPGPMTKDYRDVIEERQVTVAEDDDGIAGLIVVGPTDHGFLIDNVAVHPGKQGTGIGRALLEHAEHEARSAGYDSIYLYTNEEMTENQALYTKIGYVEYARRVRLGLARVYMRKQL